MTDDAYAVWWLSQEACEAIAGALIRYDEAADEERWVGAAERLPDYIRREFDSRYGRPGRGRLWVPEGFPPDLGIPDFDSLPMAKAAMPCGGIVIRQADAPSVAYWPGFVTDLRLRLLSPSPSSP